MYGMFKKKLEKAPPSHNIAKKKFNRNGLGGEELEEEEELCITIPLKGAKGGVSATIEIITKVNNHVLFH